MERECPWCAENILAKARVCKHCGRDVEPLDGNRPAASRDSDDPAQSVEPTADEASRATPVEETATSANATSTTSPIGGTDSAQAGDSDAAASRPPIRSELIGVSGWLAWFVLGQSLGAVMSAYNWYISIENVRVASSGDSLFARMLGSWELTALTSGFPCMGTVVGLSMILLRKRTTRAYWLAYLPIAVLLVLFYTVAARDANPTEPGGAGADNATLSRAVLLGIAWFFYWKVSKRVRATFGATSTSSDTAENSAEPPAFSWNISTPEDCWRGIDRATGASGPRVA